MLSLIVTIVPGLAGMCFVSAAEGADLIAGVSLIAPVYTMLMAFGDVFGYGGGALLAQYLGKNDHLKTKQISAFSFWSAVSFGTVVGVLLLLFQAPFVRLLGADADTYAYAADYFFWIALAAPFVLVYCTFLNVARSDGKAKEAMAAVVAGTVVNLLLDPPVHLSAGHGRRRI